MNRFLFEDETVIDRQMGLMWTKNASLLNFPLGWGEAFHSINELNTSDRYRYHDWRLPNRKELFSLISHLNFISGR